MSLQDAFNSYVKGGSLGGKKKPEEENSDPFQSYIKTGQVAQRKKEEEIAPVVKKKDEFTPDPNAFDVLNIKTDKVYNSTPAVEFDKSLFKVAKTDRIVPATLSAPKGAPYAKPTTTPEIDEFNKKAPQQAFDQWASARSEADIAARKEVVKATHTRLSQNIKTGALSMASGATGAASWIAPKSMEPFLNKKVEDIEDSIKVLAVENPTLLDSLEQGAVSAATFFIPGLGIAKGASMIASVSPKMALLFGNSMSAAMEAAVEAGSVYNEVNDELGRDEANKMASATFLSNMVLIGITNKYGAFSENVTGRLKKSITSAIMEGGQESAQQMIQNIATGKDLTEGVWESGLVGAILGAPMGAISASTVVDPGVARRYINSKYGGGDLPPDPSGGAPREKSALEMQKEFEASTDKPVKVSEAREELSKIQEEIDNGVEITDEVASRTVTLQDELQDFQIANKDSAIVMRDDSGSKIADIETVKYDDGKFGVSFEAKIEDNNLSVPFNPVDNFNSEKEAVEYAKEFINKWAKENVSKEVAEEFNKRFPEYDTPQPAADVSKISTEQLVKDLQEQGGHPNERWQPDLKLDETGKDIYTAFDRSEYVKEISKRGVDNVLADLGYSTDRNTLWRNRYTGKESSFADLVKGYDGKGEKNAELPYILESWIPAKGKNTPLAEIKIMKYRDGKWAVGTSGQVGNSGFRVGIVGGNKETFNTREEALSFAARDIYKWASNQMNEADSGTKASLEKVMKAVKPYLSPVVIDNASLETRSQKIVDDIQKLIPEVDTIFDGKFTVGELNTIWSDMMSKYQDEIEVPISEQIKSYSYQLDEIKGKKNEASKNLRKELTDKIDELNALRDDIKATLDEDFSDLGMDISTKAIELAQAQGLELGESEPELSDEWVNFRDEFLQYIFERPGIEGNARVPVLDVLTDFVSEEKGNEPATIKTQKELVAEAVKKEAKTIKEISEETKILEPNVRRILGVGTKEGVFARVDKGVYVLRKGGENIAFVQVGDAVESLKKLADKGFKADMVFLDIPYDAAGNRGGNRMNEAKNTLFETISVDQFGSVVDSVSSILRKEDSPVVYMFSQSKSSKKEMDAYTKKLLDAGYVPLAKGDYYKTSKEGKRLTQPMRSTFLDPEGIIIFNRTGEFDFKKAHDLQFTLVRPRGYKTEKPAELLKTLIEMTTDEGETVLDPFAGSGVTGAEAIKSGRKTVLIEKSEKAVEENIKPRLEKAVAEKQTVDNKIELTDVEVDPIKAQAESELLEYMEIARKGERLTVDQEGAGGSKKTIAIKSTFPQWIPEELRLSSVIKPVLAHIYAGTMPIKAKEIRLYNLINEIFTNIDAAKGEVAKEINVDEIDFGAPAEKNDELINNLNKQYEENQQAGEDIEQDSGSASGEKESTDSTEETSKGIKPATASAGANVGVFADGTPITLGSVDSIRPLHLPDMIQIIKDLASSIRINPRLRPNTRGRFQGQKGISLNKTLFEDTDQAAKTIAHEIGHLIDWSPEGALDRGNVLGRLKSLRRFMKNTFGDMEVTDKELRAELWEASTKWRPMPEAVSPGFLQYRKSAAELYADAISMLFNNPGLLEKIAPKFYVEFFNGLDAKPDVKAAFFSLQEELTLGMPVGRYRERLGESFKKADYKALELEMIERDRDKMSAKDRWFHFKREFMTIHTPFEEKAKEQRAKGNLGNILTDDDNPVHYLNELNYFGGKARAMIEEQYLPIIEKLTENGLTQAQMGEMMMYERILYGDRGKVANPFGYQKEYVEELLGESVTDADIKNVEKNGQSLKEELGEEKFNILKELTQEARNSLKALFGEGYAAGIYGEEIMKLVEESKYYSPFKVQKYMQNRTSFSVKKQVGTLSEIENPFNTLIDKSIAILRAIERNKVKTKAVNFLQEYYAGEIAKAETRFVNNRQEVIEIKDSQTNDKKHKYYGRKTVTVMQNGKMVGFIVDQYIANSIDNVTIGQNKAIVKILAWTNAKWLRPVYIGINLGFQAYNGIKDFFRYVKSMPDTGILKALGDYAMAAPHAVGKGFGKDTELVKEMYGTGVASISMSDLFSGASDEDTQLDLILSKVGIGESTFSQRHIVMKPLIAILDFIKNLGDTIEALPKVASYMQFKKKQGGEELSMAQKDFIRRYVGSPDFLMRGEWTSNTNNIFLFSNAILQGIRADVQIAKDPTTRSGFWWRTAQITLIPKILMFAAAGGLLGDWLKDIFGKATEYDKTNYTIVPLGFDKNGRAIYFRVPQDETGRFIGAFLWKIMSIKDIMTGEQTVGKVVGDIISLTGGQLPQTTAVVTIPMDIYKFASGQNIYDDFRQRNVISDKEMQAGGMYKAKPFIKYILNQAGGNIFMRLDYSDKFEKTGLEKVLQLPILSNVIGRFIKVTDYGQTEEMQGIQTKVQQEKAVKSLEQGEVIDRMAKEYRKTGGNSIFERNKFERKVIEELMGGLPKNKDEKTEAANIKKRFRLSVKKTINDSFVSNLIYATTNDEKIAMLKKYKADADPAEFDKAIKNLISEQIISQGILIKLK